MTLPLRDSSIDSVSFNKKLSSLDPSDIKKTALVIKAGGVVAFPFNGVFGLFGDIDNVTAAAKIMLVKKRPDDKSLIVVCLPEDIDKVVDFEKTKIDKENIIRLWKGIHALGVILPSSNGTPRHLTKLNDKNISTVLVIWTEYPPLRQLLDEFKRLGGRALVGTSANKNGQPTHFDFSDLYHDFQADLDLLVEDNFEHLPEVRKRSTTVVDFTFDKPILQRLGNVEMAELEELLTKYNFGKLIIDPELKQVIARSN
jgi:L-threonylcarbamoyladenylate synthase